MTSKETMLEELELYRKRNGDNANGFAFVFKKLIDYLLYSSTDFTEYKDNQIFRTTNTWTIKNDTIYHINLPQESLPFQSIDFYTELKNGVWTPISTLNLERTGLTGTSPYTLNMLGSSEKKFAGEAAANIVIGFTNTLNSFTANILIKKTVAGDVTVTFPANSVSNNSAWEAGVLTLSGAINSWHEISVEGYLDDATLHYFVNYSEEYV